MQSKETLQAFTILLVDDRPENLISLEELLIQPGRRFIKAQSGNEALRQVLKHENIGLIMLDVQMPAGKLRRSVVVYHLICLYLCLIH